MDLTGAIDLHVHTGPDVVERKQDDHEMVADAQAAGMAAVLIKSHVTLTADRASLAGRGGKIRVFGGVVLNQHVGGLNPVAAETAIELGAKQIWMPTLHAQNCMDKAEVEMFRREVERGRQGISILDESGGVIDRVLTILEIVRDADAILGTGHIAPEESLALLVAAKDIGLTRLLVTHPLMHFTYFDRDQMRAAAQLGAKLEFDYLSCCTTWHRAVSPAVSAAAIRDVGAAYCVCASDGGQHFNEKPTDMLQSFASELRRNGIEEDELRLMMCENPAELLDL